jgi:hypothetical protein
MRIRSPAIESWDQVRPTWTAGPSPSASARAFWNDVDPAREAEYECWHTFEHVPERVGIAGFLSGRRYRASERSESQYFTLYELESLAALGSPNYAKVVDHPTDQNTKKSNRVRSGLPRRVANCTWAELLPLPSASKYNAPV